MTDERRIEEHVLIKPGDLVWIQSLALCITVTKHWCEKAVPFGVDRVFDGLDITYLCDNVLHTAHVSAPQLIAIYEQKTPKGLKID